MANYRKGRVYKEGKGGIAFTGEEGGRPGLVDESTKIEDEVWAADWTSPLNANNPPDPFPDNNYISPTKIYPANTLQIAAVSEAIAQRRRKGW